MLNPWAGTAGRGWEFDKFLKNLVNSKQWGNNRQSKVSKRPTLVQKFSINTTPDNHTVQQIGRPVANKNS